MAMNSRRGRSSVAIAGFFLSVSLAGCTPLRFSFPNRAPDLSDIADVTSGPGPASLGLGANVEAPSCLGTDLEYGNGHWAPQPYEKGAARYLCAPACIVILGLESPDYAVPVPNEYWCLNF